MKRKFDIFSLMIAALVLLAACQAGPSSSGSITGGAEEEKSSYVSGESSLQAESVSSFSAPDFQDGTLTYSNLVGEDVQSDVQKILLKAGIPQPYVEKVFQWVQDFNQCMQVCESFELIDEFTTKNIAVVDYGDYYPMSTAWFKTNNRRYGDVLCRIAAFELLQDAVKVEHPIEKSAWECGDDQWLCSDYDAIANNPLVEFDQQLQSRYFTLFNPVSISENCTETEMFQSISGQWQERGISFIEGEASLITIWTQYKTQTAAAHAAVLVENQGGYLLFEKTNPQSPYQATKFSTVEQVRQYMYESIHQEDLRYNDETGVYLVMQNNRVL